MITEKEVQATLLSPTKKDFYQVWNELLDTASKLSDRWTPSETNESDPGIVLLKVLTACADKLNYNIDKNTLEAFMPSAAQEESMRKLCDMMGYNMKYYRAATTDVTIYYNGDASSDFQASTISSTAELILPKFTNITTTDGDINYVTTSQISFNRNITTNKVECIEGTLAYCEEDNNNIVTINNIDDNNRYYFPVNNVAENGIFIYDILDSVKSEEEWELVDNLNTVALNKKCFKFGFDSKEMLPYIQFPSDISSIINDGLVIAYIVTNGVNGNIKAKTLSKFTPPSDWNSETISEINQTGVRHSESEFSCYNVSAATNGANRETIDDAYVNFKKTIGTFDTLITCRDYMNKIYELETSANNTTPLVSNSIVSDIRDDINKSITICSFNEFGINYLDEPLYREINSEVTGKDSNGNTQTIIVNEKEPLINNFDLILYPFKTVYDLNTKAEHDSSFTYDKSVYNKVLEDLAEIKTISHKISLPKEDTENYPYDEAHTAKNTSEIVLIKNYLKLVAKMTATRKINDIEQTDIKNNIKTALYEKFNLRQLDFGEEIPFDDILNTIQNADVRIKNVALDEPVLYTRFTLANNSEYDVAVKWDENMDDNDDTTIDKNKLTGEYKMKQMMCASELSAYNAIKDEDSIKLIQKRQSFRKNRELKAKEIYNKLALRNILAGRVNLFNYVTDFTPSVKEARYEDMPLIFPRTDVTTQESKQIYSIVPELTISNVPTEESKDLVLKENQIIQFRAPNFKTVVTYPGYVNYFIKLNKTTTSPASPATFITLHDYCYGKGSILKGIAAEGKYKPTSIAVYNPAHTEEEKAVQKSIFESIKSQYGGMFIFTSEGKTWGSFETIWPGDKETPPTETQKFAIFENTSSTYGTWFNYIKKNYSAHEQHTDGIYKSLGFDATRVIGKYIDTNKNKFKLDNVGSNPAYPMTYYFVPEFHDKDEAGKWTKDGLGKDAVYAGITADAEYKLQKGEFLCINYTNAEAGADTSAIEEGGEATISSTSEVINVYYGPGTIIKPNAELIDSASRKESGKSYSKTSGYDFSKELGPTYISIVPGMYSLAASEQIEIREKVNIYVYDNTENSKVFVYFKLNNETVAKDDYITFLGNIEEGEEKNNSRILEEGEYFWYTDKNKTTLTYCGNGTEIINKTGVEIKKKYSEEWSSAEKILEESNIDNIPWISLTNLIVKKDDKEKVVSGKYIEWFEYQYISLIESDTLKCTSLKTNGQTIDSTWRPVLNNTTKYIIDGTEGTLPEINLGTNEDVWDVRTRLEVNTSSIQVQTLHSCPYSETLGESGPVCVENIKLLDSEDKEILTTEHKFNKNDLSLKTNYPINGTSDKIITHYTLTDSSGVDYEVMDDFSVKAFKNNTIYTKENVESQKEAKILNNMSTYFTSFTFSDGEKDKKYSTLYCAIPDEVTQYGLIMFYYVSNNKTFTDNSFIKLTNGTPVIFNNYVGDNMSWWSGRVSDSKYYLKPNSLNVIRIPKSTNIEIYAGASTEDVLIFSPLRIVSCDIETVEGTVRSDEGLDLDLLQYYNTESLDKTARYQRATQLLSDLRELDPDYKFFYNTIIDGSVSLDINTLAEENLATPRLWYNYNNINNKFVVSEIDSGYIDSGITFASSSIKFE